MSEDTQTKDVVASHMAQPGDAAHDFHEHMSRGCVSEFPVFSSECIECDCLAFDEVAYEDDLSLRSRVLCRLSMLLGCRVANGAWGMSSAALISGVDAASLKEDVYQVSPFRKVKSKVFIRHGAILPLDSVIATASDTESQREGGERHGWICAGVTMNAVAPAVPT